MRRNTELATRLAADRAYDNSAAFPDVPEWRQIWRERSQGVAIVEPARLDISYGRGTLQRLDVFPCADRNAATAIFVHGGFWSRNSKETFRFLIRGIHAAGLNAIFLGHTLAPNARMDEIVADVRSAAEWIFTRLEKLGLSARPLIMIGWSSGAQLAAMTMGADFVGAGIGNSGIYDLKDMRQASTNDVLQLDRDEALRNSATINLPLRSGPFVAAYGAGELAAFRVQSEQFYYARMAATLPSELLALPGRHHHSALEELYDPAGLLTRVLTNLAA